jgi:hypothetical protein
LARYELSSERYNELSGEGYNELSGESHNNQFIEMEVLEPVGSELSAKRLSRGMRNS